MEIGKLHQCLLLSAAGGLLQPMVTSTKNLQREESHGRRVDDYVKDVEQILLYMAFKIQQLESKYSDLFPNLKTAFGFVFLFIKLEQKYPYCIYFPVVNCKIAKIGSGFFAYYK